MAGFQRTNLLQPHAPTPQPRGWNERIVPHMLWDESRIRSFTPDDIEERLRLMRDYPMEMTEAGETYALVPPAAQPPQLPPWRTDVMPEAGSWRTEVRPNYLRGYQQ